MSDKIGDFDPAWLRLCSSRRLIELAMRHPSFRPSIVAELERRGADRSLLVLDQLESLVDSMAREPRSGRAQGDRQRSPRRCRGNRLRPMDPL